jgi:hypothetical protein
MAFELAALGFRPCFERQPPPSSGEHEVIPARIAAEHRGAYEVWATTGSRRAYLAGRLRLELGDGGAPGVGDRVVIKDAPDPDLIGTSLLGVLDAVIEALANEDLVVILDNHRRRSADELSGLLR